MNYILKSPLDVQVELTSLCNHHCRHCYNFWRYEEKSISAKKNTLKTQDIEKIFYTLREKDVISVTITGGEPLLFPEKVFQCLELSEKLGIKTDINSNLTLMNDEIIDRISEFKNISILTSLLSYRSNPHDLLTGIGGSHERVVNAIKKCNREGINVSVNMVLCKENINQIYENAVFVHKLGVNTFCATRAVPPLGSGGYDSYAISTQDLVHSLNELIKIEENLKMNTEILGCYPKCTLLPNKKHRKFFGRICVAGKTTMTISSDGEVRPCSHSDEIYGNILYEELDDIWLRMERWRDGSYIPTICKNCNLVNTCTCGCRIEAQYNGDIRGVDKDAIPENAKLFPIKENAERVDYDNLKRIFSGKIFVFDKNICFREELFGGIMHIAKSRNILTVNNSAFNFLKEAVKNNQIEFCEFEINSGAKKPDDFLTVASLFNRLISKGFIKERR